VIVIPEGIQLEEGEPNMRSCWECNGGHEHLKKLNMLTICFLCNRLYVLGEFIPDFDGDDKAGGVWVSAFLKRHGLEVGQSTKSIDLGYRISVITLEARDATRTE
jgi:hypothetical protein